MNEVVVLVFANLRERVGSSQVTLSVEDDATIRDLKKALIDAYPNIRSQLNKVVISINQEIVLEDDLIPPGAEVAILPPISGGSSGEHPLVLKIQTTPIDQDDLVERITGGTTGAVCTFTGIVRGITSKGEDSYRTTALEYEAYDSMAEKMLEKVAEEIRSKWPAIEGIGIVQRIGTLEAGTPTVLIACAASHRDTGVFEAARYGIDRLKEVVPVWKKEIGPDGEEWVEGKSIRLEPSDLSQK